MGFRVEFGISGRVLSGIFRAGKYIGILSLHNGEPNGKDGRMTWNCDHTGFMTSGIRSKVYYLGFGVGGLKSIEKGAKGLRSIRCEGVEGNRREHGNHHVVSGVELIANPEY